MIFDGPAKRTVTTAQIFVLRLSSAMLGAALFGLLSAPLLGFPGLVSAILLAFCYGFFFVGGTGYRILVAVAVRDPHRQATPSWAGAAAVSTLAVVVAAIVLATMNGDATVLLAAHAVALNAAYLPVKFACILAQCCGARRPFGPFGGRPLDLRRLEFVLTFLTFAAALLCLANGAAAVGVAVGLAGHLGVRLLSRWARHRMPRRILSADGVGQEVAPLVLALGLAVILALRP